ncbi:MAG: hypothetical protein QN178_08200 [Armatimonadota bacterium]|nr:hypothetical protein [Armatimonadota bacterium]
MRPSVGAPPRHDPRTIYAIQADRASGLSVEEIATKHNLSRFAVQTVLRPAAEPSGMASPFEFRHKGSPPNAAVQVYWLGYITATGRIFGQSSQGTLVLAIHPLDEPHVQDLVRDLVTGHPRVEFADSNLKGRQAYIRDRQLAEVLLQWGISSTANSSTLSFEFLPKDLVPDFVRGYLEGSRSTLPFGGHADAVPAPTSVRSLSFEGSHALIAAFEQALRTASGIRPVRVRALGSTGQAKITLPQAVALKILASAYAHPLRASPRAAKFVARFSVNSQGPPTQVSGRRARVLARP